jgi:hypothetical protein
VKKFIFEEFPVGLEASTEVRLFFGGFFPYSGRPKLSPKAKKGKSKEILCLRVLCWAGSFS